MPLCLLYFIGFIGTPAIALLIIENNGPTLFILALKNTPTYLMLELVARINPTELSFSELSADLGGFLPTSFKTPHKVGLTLLPFPSSSSSFTLLLLPHSPFCACHHQQLDTLVASALTKPSHPPILLLLMHD